MFFAGRAAPASDYDGGDCCACTCVSTSDFTCGDASNGGFDCIDPRAPCVDDDDDEFSASFSYELSGEFVVSSCIDHLIGDGDCQALNNKAECGESAFLSGRTVR